MSNEPELGDLPIEQLHVREMNQSMKYLDMMFNGKVGGKDRNFGLVLMVFPYGESDGRCNYISNGANRHDVEKLLFDQARRFRRDRKRKS